MPRVPNTAPKDKKNMLMRNLTASKVLFYIIGHRVNYAKKITEHLYGKGDNNKNIIVLRYVKEWADLRIIQQVEGKYQLNIKNYVVLWPPFAKLCADVLNKDIKKSGEKIDSETIQTLMDNALINNWLCAYARAVLDHDISVKEYIRGFFQGYAFLSDEELETALIRLVLDTIDAEDQDIMLRHWEGKEHSLPAQLEHLKHSTDDLNNLLLELRELCKTYVLNGGVSAQHVFDSVIR